MTTNRNIHDVIVEKIHSQFVELVPEDELRVLVENTVTAFKTAVRVKKDQWTPEKIDPSPLEKMVYKAIDELMGKAIAKHIDLALGARFDAEGQRIASEVLEKVVTKAAPAILQYFILNAAGNIAGVAVGNLRNEMSQRGVMPWS